MTFLKVLQCFPEILISLVLVANKASPDTRWRHALCVDMSKPVWCRRQSSVPAQQQMNSISPAVQVSPLYYGVADFDKY